MGTQGTWMGMACFIVCRHGLLFCKFFFFFFFYKCRIFYNCRISHVKFTSIFRQRRAQAWLALLCVGMACFTVCRNGLLYCNFFFFFFFFFTSVGFFTTVGLAM